MASTNIYLDYAAATPVDPAVMAVMQPFFSEQYYNPSATYLAAKAVADQLKYSRSSVSANIGARTSEIVFTAGGSEANNLAIHGVMRNFPEANCLVSTIEHDSVLAPSARYDRRLIPVNDHGLVEAEAVSALVDDNTVLISIMYANNEIGTIQPIKDIGQHVAQIRKLRKATGNTLPLYLHTDAAQAANYLDMHVSRLGVDLMTINGGKIYGPKQSGCLYVKAGVSLQPLIDGGGQEKGLRSGTENVAAAAGFAKALEITQQQRPDESKRLGLLQQHFFKAMKKTFPSAKINGSKSRRLPNNIHLTFPGVDNERLLIQLDETGIQAAAGSACSASKDIPSHVLSALGISDDTARNSIRITMGRQTTDDHMETVVKTLARLLA